MFFFVFFLNEMRFWKFNVSYVYTNDLYKNRNIYHRINYLENEHIVFYKSLHISAGCIYQRRSVEIKSNGLSHVLSYSGRSNTNSD